MKKILHLYYDIMNLYGEYGNVKIFKKHLEDQGEEVQLDRKTIGDNIVINDYDFIYIGSGTEKNQRVVLEDLKKYKDDIKKYIEDEKLFLATGNSYEMFGKKIDENEALGIFDFEVSKTKDRITSDIIYRSKFFDKKVVGFVNKMSNIMHNINPLFEVEFGVGENENKDYEGIKYKNFYGTYVSGPILVRNPDVLKALLKLLCKEYKEIEYENEEDGYKLILEELSKRK